MIIIEVPPRPVTIVEYNLAALGLPVAGNKDKRLAMLWRAMMSRCYDCTDHNYASHGAEGVTVSSDWQDCLDFIDDVRSLEGFAEQNVSLDKDYYSSKQYGTATSIWLSPRENATYAQHVRAIVFEGTTYLSLSLASEATGTSVPHIKQALASGKASYAKSLHPLRAKYRF